jgi:hypothetical protein
MVVACQSSVVGHEHGTATRRQPIARAIVTFDKFAQHQTRSKTIARGGPSRQAGEAYQLHHWPGFVNSIRIYTGAQVAPVLTDEGR